MRDLIGCTGAIRFAGSLIAQVLLVLTAPLMESLYRPHAFGQVAIFTAAARVPDQSAERFHGLIDALEFSAFRSQHLDTFV